jgi:two-component system, cell cycle sensor histidine kinase and response regulator CckA
MSIEHCILIAEDDAITLRLTVRALQPQGYCLLQARDGLEALHIAHGHNGDIDLLITNVNMPEMTGHELARIIKEERPGTRVLIVSGVDEADFPPEAVHHSDALLKPVSPKRLLRKVKELLAA